MTWTVLMLLLAHAPSVRGQGDEPMVYTVGLSSSVAGQSWAYLHWRSTAFDLFSSRAWSVWRKDGLPSDPGPYQLEAVVQVQTSPAVIASLLHRAQTVLGENPGERRVALEQLFEELLTDTNLSDGELASAIIQGVAAHPEFLHSLQTVMRFYPSMAMALGTAHAVPIPAAGPVTFEIRHRPALQAPDEGVVGRVTVDASAPLVLPPPTVVTVAPPDPDRPATGDLNVPLRWDVPAPLRRLAVAQNGFDVFRVPRALAEGEGWQKVAPALSALQAQLDDPASGVDRVNSAPVLPVQMLDAAAALAADHTIVFTTDHESRFPDYPDAHTPPVNGDQFYYFVASRDLLGRIGALSPGVLGTFCSRMPPRVPSIVSIENVFDFNGGSPKHHLKITWAANPAEEDKTTVAYALYRWTNVGHIYELGGNPAMNLVTVIPHTGSPSTFSYVDDGSGSPSAPNDYNRTFWYTVRAIDDAGEVGECVVPPFDGNISGHSAPRFGVLRDRSGPGFPEGMVRIRCARPTVEIQRETRLINEREPQPHTVFLEYLVERANADPNLEWVELFWGLGQSEVLLGRFEFEPGASTFKFRFGFPAALGGGGIFVRARAGAANGETADSDPLSVSLPQAGSGLYREVTVKTAIVYTPVSLDRDGVREPCRGHSSPPPGTPGGELDGLDFVLLLPEGTVQYKLYYRIDDGPLTLLKEDSGEFDPMTPVDVLWQSLPVYAFDACFFVQAFDMHGNPSPMVPLGCTSFNLKFGPPKPILAPILPGGTESDPTAKIDWFAPRWGLERFQLLIHSSPLPPADLSPELTPDGIVFIMKEVNSNPVPVAHRAYLTQPVSALGQGSLFGIEVPVDGEVKWSVAVRAVTGTGTKGKLSNFEEFEWAPPEVLTGPNVPWPKRPLPGTVAANQFNFRIIAEPFQGSGAIRIGEVYGRTTFNQTGGTRIDAGGDPMTYLYSGVLSETGERQVLPLVLYRTQLPGGDWPEVPGDVVQVSPLMEAIAWTAEGASSVIYDPFIWVDVGSGNPSAPMYMRLIDTQPAVRGGVYRYFLVLLDAQTREIVRILVSNDVTL